MQLSRPVTYNKGLDGDAGIAWLLSSVSAKRNRATF